MRLRAGPISVALRRAAQMFGRVGWVVLLIGLSLSTLSAIAADGPNIMVILADDLGWSDNDIQGQDGFYETPQMRRLAAQGLSFQSAYASCPVCSPTRASIMTGKSPARTRITNWISGSTYNGQSNLREPAWTKNLPASEVTLAEALRDDGYQTIHLGKWHLGQSGPSADPTQNGFDINIGGGSAGNPGGYFADSMGRFPGVPGLDQAGTSNPGDYLTDVLTDHAIQYVQDHATDAEPFFMYLSHFAVHSPIQAPAALVQKYQDKLDANPGAFPHHHNPTYAAMVENLDTNVGRILDVLEAAGIADDTLLVFHSDNGGLANAQGGTSGQVPTSSHPLAGGKGTMNEGGVRVPLMFSGAGLDPTLVGQVTEEMAITHDLYPTLLSVAGVAGDPSHNAELDGIDLAAVLSGTGSGRQAAFWHYPHISDQDGFGGLPNGAFVSAMRDGDWKLIYQWETTSAQLFKLAQDIGEEEDVATANPNRTRQLTNALTQYLIDVDAQLPTWAIGGQPVDLPNIIDSFIGDLTGDDQILVDDWQAFRAVLGTGITAATDIEAEQQGDFDFDLHVGLDDFTVFKFAYDEVHGAGAFEAMVANVPEPCLASMLCGILWSAAMILLRRRQPSQQGELRCHSSP